MGRKGEGKYFASPNEAITAHDFDMVGYRAKIKVTPSDKEKYAAFDGKPFDTTVGRLLFNAIFLMTIHSLTRRLVRKRLIKS